MWKEIQKFGLKHSDLPTLVSNINVMLRVLTLNVDSRLTTRMYQLQCRNRYACKASAYENFRFAISFVSYLVTGCGAVCYYYAYQLSLVWFLFWRKETSSLVAMIVFGSLAVSSNVAIVKLWYMIAYGSKVRCLVDQCVESNSLIEPNSRFARNMTHFLRKVKIRDIFFWTSVMTISILYVTLPAFMTGRHLPGDFLVLYGLDPPYETPNFQISYIVMTISVNFISYITATIFAFNIIILGYNEAQMISLSEEVLHVWDDSIQDAIEFNIDLFCGFTKNKPMFNDNTKKKINLGVQKRLIKIAQNHSKTVTLVKNINDFFNIPNAFAFGCLGISLIAELLAGLQNTYLQVPFTFMQVALDCFTGQKIMDASEAFEKAVYACKWENFDSGNRKIVLLMLQNSQKTLTVSAGSMAVMNFTCLMSIVRSVYSSYTTLRSMI